MAKKIVTNNGKNGGWLVGKRHYDKSGKPIGGIKAVVTDAGGKPVELEGGEVIINREASKKHWKELSKINQSAGNGVAIGPPSGAFDEDPSEDYENGGKIEFNVNHVPNKWILNYAIKIKEDHPEIWDLGGNIFGNQAFVNLKRVSERGYWLDSEEWMYKKWRSFVARHQRDYRIPGVIAMLKWVDKVGKGWQYMKNLIEEEIKKREEKKSRKMTTGGSTPAPLKDRIKGSKFNTKGTASTSSKAESIKFDDKTIASIQSLIDTHNEKHPSNKITLAAAKAVVRRGMGAYSSSYRPTITGGKPNSSTAWGLARLKAFIYKAEKGKSKSGKYSQDNDLFEELNISVQKMNTGGGIDSKREYLEKRLWNERGYDYPYLNKLSFKELRSLYDTEFYYDVEMGDELFDNGGKLEMNISLKLTKKVIQDNALNNGWYLETIGGYGNPIATIYNSKGKEIKMSTNYDVVQKWKTYFEEVNIKPTRDGQKYDYRSVYKLADGTNVTFDGSNPDIRFEYGGKMKRQVLSSEFYDQGGNIDYDSIQPKDKNGVPKIDDKSLEILTERILKLPQTKSFHTDENGNYTKERKELHKEIINEFKKEAVCITKDRPIAILMGGSPASGKSSFIKKYRPYLMANDIVKVDADEIRAKLPEYRGFNATQTHLETKDIVTTLISDRNIGVPCEFDLIYDGTMNSVKSYEPLIDLLKKLNYKIFIIYIDRVPYDTVVTRMKERYKKSGRFVPIEVIDDFFSKGRQAVDKLKNEVDGYVIVDGSNFDYDIIERGGEELPQERNHKFLGTPIDKKQLEKIQYKGGGKIDGGDCYQTAGDFVLDSKILGETRTNKIKFVGEPHVVHAQVTGQGAISGLKYGHAWIEDDQLVYDYSNGRELVIPKDFYYAVGKVKKTKPRYFKYTFEEARKKMLDSGHYGPWDLKTESGL